AGEWRRAEFRRLPAGLWMQGGAADGFRKRLPRLVGSGNCLCGVGQGTACVGGGRPPPPVKAERSSAAARRPVLSPAPFDNLPCLHVTSNFRVKMLWRQDEVPLNADSCRLFRILLALLQPGSGF